MTIEDQLPEIYKKTAYHPSAFVYAWKKKDLEKLFDELNLSNMAILSAEAWLVEDEVITSLIPLQGGDIQVYFVTNKQQDDEEWNDFVNRTTKDTLQIINGWNLEKSVSPQYVHKIWYHFKFQED